MRNNIINSNIVSIIGEVASEFCFSHEAFGERFYVVNVLVKRLSNTKDSIQLMISERLIDVAKNYTGAFVKVSGQYRSYNYHENQSNHLILSVYVRKITIINDEEYGFKTNSIILDGHICKQPVFRITPMEKKITELLVAVNRPFGKADYIPCICWGINALYASDYNVGDQVHLIGRIQSREYTKKLAENKSEKRIAYEVSISKIYMLRPIAV